MIDTFYYRNVSLVYRKDTVDEKVLGHSFANDIFYPQLTELKVTKDMTVVDIGAHIGTFAINTSLLFEGCTIYACEPFPESFDLLQQNIQRNDLTNIKPIKVAVAGNSGQQKLHLSPENWEHSISNDFGGNSVMVDSLTLKDLFINNQIDFVDLVKFNCEGAEFDILYATGAEVFQKIGMMLILFHEDFASEEHSRKSLEQFLIGKGFDIHVPRLNKQRGWIIAKNTKYYTAPHSTAADVDANDTIIHKFLNYFNLA